MNRRLLFLVGLAFMLRLIFGLSQDHLVVYRMAGGDSGWYLLNGYALVTGVDTGFVAVPGGEPVMVDLSGLPTAPLYLIFVGIWRTFLSPDLAVIVIRVLQALMGSALVWLAYRLAWRISQREVAGWIVAVLIALSPVFIIEAAQITTETLYLFLIAAGLCVYLETGSQSWRGLALVALLLGLATLTRAVLLAFPLGLAFHLLLVNGWREGLKRALFLLVVYGLVVSTWTVYNRVRYERWVIGAQGLFAFLYVGSTDANWQGPGAVDASLQETTGAPLPTNPEEQQQVYQQAALQNITRDLGAWLGRRGKALLEANLQPHGTTFFPGESLRELGLNWLATDRSLGGLVQLTGGDAFWPKLALYALHYLGIGLGLIGIGLTRRQWRWTLPLLGFIVYTLLLHFVLDAIPRYLFPLELFWWVFAACAIARFVPRSQGESHVAA